MTGHDQVATLLDRVVRRERGRLIAGLVHRLGGQHLALAEDVAQDAILAALATWPYRGLPDKPAAWLRTVATNKAIDRLRRGQRDVPLVASPDEAGPDQPDLLAARIEDPELRLMVLCCHDALTGIDRLAITLKLVSGFTAREIGAVLLVSEAAMSQRLARARRKLRAVGPSIDEAPSRFDIEARTGTLLKVIYLMFSVGYAPRSGTELIRSEVANEALRLARELADGSAARSNAAALAALLCFQSSRREARRDADGRVVLLKDQDRALWDRGLIEDGLAYLIAAQKAQEVSRFHLEAGIAAIYASAPSWEDCDWQTILMYYQRLEDMTGSPVVSINASVARAMAGSPGAALERLDALADDTRLQQFGPYHLARAEILSALSRDEEAAASYQHAIDCGASDPVADHLSARLAACLQ